ncbi:MAG: flagellar hook-length control protein FliK, partial [Phycisphaerae bacterium]
SSEPAISSTPTLAASPEKPAAGVPAAPGHGPTANVASNGNGLSSNAATTADAASGLATGIAPPAPGLLENASAAGASEPAAPAKAVTTGPAQAAVGAPSVLTATTPTSPAAPGGTTGAEIARAAQDPPPVDRQQLLDQVMAGLRTKIDARNGQAEIRLDPPNLGTLRVRIQMDNGTVSAQFFSDHSVVRGLLSENMDKLRSVLQSQGIAVDRLAVPPPTHPAAVPAGNLANGPGGDGRSAGHQGYSGRQAPDGQKSERGDFATVWQQTSQAPLDLVA